MRFLNSRDYEALVKLNQELVNRVVDTTVVLYKLHQMETKQNSYGEATNKKWYVGVEIPALIDRGPTSASEELQTVSVDQECKFAFLRRELIERGVYPEQGDIVWFDQQYYEIHNTNETQLVVGRPEYRHSIVCETHLTRNTNLQLEPPIR